MAQPTSTTPSPSRDQIQFLNKYLGTEEFQIFPLAGDASSRRYFRVVRGKQSFVFMVWEPFQDPENFPFVSVQKHFAKCGVKVPEILSLSGELGVILLEDLGDLTLERKFWENQDQRMALPFYKMAIDELIKMHYTASSDPVRKCTAFHISFNHERLLWELNYGRKHLIEGVAKISLSVTESKLLDEVFDQICKILDAEPKFIAHRDYHSRNVMIQFGETRIIDFQDARLGPIQYDLVSLFCDSYVDLSPEIVEELTKYYLRLANAHLPRPIEREHFDEIYEVQTLQRCFKACGSFASFFNMREDRRYLKYLPQTLNRVAKTARQSGQFKNFGDFLEDKGLLQIEYNKL